MTPNIPDVKTLRRLRPLAEFDDDQLRNFANQLDVRLARKMDLLIEQGCADDFSLFVLEGEISVIARDGKEKEMTINSQQELTPLAELRPSMYDIKALGLVKYLKIDKKQLTEFAQLANVDGDDISLQMIDDGHHANAVTMKLYQDLMADAVELPSLPEVAHKIQQLYHQDDADAQRIAAMLMNDPAITAKLIKVANSALYKGASASQTLQEAVVRIGMKNTYQLVMAYAANELFKTQSKAAQQRMAKLWSHSRKVAAIARVLAKETGLFDPEQAMLAGLTHDVGAIVVVDYISRNGEAINDDEAVDETVHALRAQIGGMLLSKWNFAEDMITVAEQGEDWFRNNEGKADLCDLVIIAQYHSLIGTDEMRDVPPITMLPAMKKLDITLKQSMDLVKQSNKEIRELEQLLQ